MLLQWIKDYHKQVGFLSYQLYGIQAVKLEPELEVRGNYVDSYSFDIFFLIYFVAGSKSVKFIPWVFVELLFLGTFLVVTWLSGVAVA